MSGNFCFHPDPKVQIYLAQKLKVIKEMYYLTGFESASSTGQECLLGLNIIIVIKCLYLNKSSSVALLLLLTEPATHSIVLYFDLNFFDPVSL